MTFGALLRQFRTQRLIGLREMAEECKMDSGNYAKIETGKLIPPNSREKILKLTEPLALAEDEIAQLISAARSWHEERLRKRFE